MRTNSAGRPIVDGGVCVGLVALACALGCDPRSDGRGGAGGGIGVPGEDGAEDAEDDGEGEDPSDPGDGSDDDDDAQPAAPVPTPELPFDPEQLGKLCARGSADRVATALCDGTDLHGIGDLRAALEFQSPFFALTANSSSLVARGVSAINPRLVMGDRIGVFDETGRVGGIEDTLALGFARGEQLVELMAFDPIADELNFYLLRFEQDCNDTEEGCTAADLVTPAVEQNWTRWTLYQDVDLVNTTLDCNVCHQPLGPGTPKIPRIQEVSNSWTHWFPVRPADEGGGWASGGNGTAGLPVADSDNHGTRSSEVLWSMFERMHGGEGIYGGVTIEELRPSAAGPDLETFVKTYMLSREMPAPLQVPNTDYFCDSASMEVLGAGSSWQTEYQRVLAGERLPLPSMMIDITQETKREESIESYVRIVTGLASPDTLVDPRYVTTTEALVEMSVLPRDDASAQEILTHMCSRCHNGSLDPSLTRARFDATALEALTEADKAVIADRLMRGHDDKHVMPPPRFAVLPDWALDRVLAWLLP
jgi:hypothetical protein